MPKAASLPRRLFRIFFERAVFLLSAIPAPPQLCVQAGAISTAEGGAQSSKGPTGANRANLPNDARSIICRHTDSLDIEEQQ